ncbi:MAG TPA: ATP synthase F1 subunit delta [Candidatus Binatia bacterium]|nr:ATP synthase F1 subunit delta [Candidatus Binatia bacterium]
MNGRLAKRYARAVFELAREDGTFAAVAEELGAVAATFEEPRLHPFVLNPAIDPAARLRTARAVAGALGVSRTVANLVALLAERNRLVLLAEIARWYETFLDDELGRARVTIRCAAPLSPAERNEVVELARRLTGRREVLPTTEVDPELLGGVTLDIGGTVYDGSLKTQLARLTKDMAEGGA